MEGLRLGASVLFKLNWLDGFIYVLQACSTYSHGQALEAFFSIYHQEYLCTSCL